MQITYGSVCSGIEAATVAWEPLGWKAAWFSEIEPYPSALLNFRYPTVPNLGDMTKLASYIKLGLIVAPDILVGGTPCQAFSVAGLRKSLSDTRGQLTLSFVELANEIDNIRAVKNLPATTIVWENVPGVLNTSDNAFGCFIAGLAGEDLPLEPPRGKWSNAGYVIGPKRSVAWRVLDAQYFGVAQRRRRVFVVASARDGFSPAEVLFEWDGVRRDTPPSRETGEEVTGTLDALANRSVGVQDASAGFIRPVICMAHGQGGAEIRTDGGAPTLTCNHEAPIAAYPANNNKPACYGMQVNIIGRQPHNGGNGLGFCEDVAPTLTKQDRHGVVYSMQVRRLMPIECERLQGFPDGHTAIPWGNKPASECPDGPRYKALGNSMCTKNMRWIGERLAKCL